MSAIVALEESVWLVPLDEQAAITIPVVTNAGNNRDLTGPARNSDRPRAVFAGYLPQLFERRESSLSGHGVDRLG